MIKIVMEFREANRILQSVKAAMAADGIKLPSATETDGIMLLLGKLDADKYIARKSAHAARPAARDGVLFCRALCAVRSGLPEPVTYASAMLLHKSLFGDGYADAGRPRATEASTSGSSHTDPKYISGSLKAIISKMNELACSPVVGKEDFAGYLTHYMRELLILRPFERGSSFTLRLFMIMFCKQKGFALSYSRVAPATIRAVEETAFLTDDVTPMYKMFINCLSYERTAVAPPRHVRSKREADKKPTPRRPAPLAQNATDEIAAVKLKAATDGKSDIDDAKLKRIIKLQQKISKLNEQLVNELSTDDLDTND